jgi:hypothetical protein
MNKMQKYGNIDSNTSHMVVPLYQLQALGITPDINRSYLIKNDIYYKVVGIEDRTDHKHIRCYYLTIRKEEVN